MIVLNKEEIIDCEYWDRTIMTLGLWEDLKNARTIVIKPNFAAGTHIDPKTHVMTDQALLRTTIKNVHRINPNAVIYIAESDSTGYGFAFLKFEHLNLPMSLGLNEDELKKINLLDLSRDRLIQVENKKFKRYKNIDSQLWLSETLIKADFIINLCNLKTHTVTGFTGACKNLFGCLPDFEKYHNHPFIHHTIHDLVIALQPNLNIVDAFYGMQRNGPVQGEDVDSGYRVFSNDAFEADVYASTTIGYKPQSVKYLRLLSSTIEKSFDTDANIVSKYRRADHFVRVMNYVGLFIQRCGLSIEVFGHRIHTCNNLLNLCITIVRPLLLKLFDYEKLKAWKKRLYK